MERAGWRRRGISKAALQPSGSLNGKRKPLAPQAGGALSACGEWPQLYAEWAERDLVCEAGRVPLNTYFLNESMNTSQVNDNTTQEILLF